MIHIQKSGHSTIYQVTAFIASFLIFSIEPMLGKKFLPIFGGASLTWIILMLFFTTTLFSGYIYSHFLTKLKTTTQQRIHIPIILASVLTVFITTNLSLSNIIRIDNPTTSILVNAIIAIGLPFFVLSTTSLLLQKWFTQSHPNEEPYFLYQISNLGALVGLIIYPLLFEPFLTLSSQQLLWNLLFIALCIMISFLNINSRSNFTTKTNITIHSKPSLKLFLFWLTLSLIPNLLLLASTTFLTQGITATPLLWIAPLMIYLISYIIGFSKPRFFPQEFNLFIIFFLTIAFSLTQTRILGSLNSQSLQLILIFLTLLFSGLAFHHELYLKRPSPNNLTSYYIAIGLGGIIATIICGLISPSYFTNYWEIPLTLGLAIIMTLYILLFSIKKLFIHKGMYIVFSLYALAVLANSYLPMMQNNPNIMSQTRNFYGVTSIAIENQSLPSETIKQLYNGSIIHGFQYTNIDKEMTATSYYSNITGIGMLIENKHKITLGAPTRYGIVGLGVGTLSSYCQPKDYYKYYEINPRVIDIANNEFTFLKNCKSNGGTVDIMSGDARINLSNEANQNFDILVIDAFTDDSIPTHLLTAEAVELYTRHLSPNGIIAFHITNKYLELKYVLQSIAKNLNLTTSTHEIDLAEWFFMTKNGQSYIPTLFDKQVPIKSNIAPWTDDYSNILDALK